MTIKPSPIIELSDSLGLQASIAKYLAAAEKFVKDALCSEELAGRTVIDHGRYIGWESLDRSGDLPRQGNGHDCGIFMLTSMSLVRSGLRLSKEAYSHTRHSHVTTGKEAPGGTHMGNGSQ